MHGHFICNRSKLGPAISRAAAEERNDEAYFVQSFYCTYVLNQRFSCFGSKNVRILTNLEGNAIQGALSFVNLMAASISECICRHFIISDALLDTGERWKRNFYLAYQIWSVCLLYCLEMQMQPAVLMAFLGTKPGGR